ncbi:MAG: LPS assembly lipoprotein LptE [Alcanivoracaceae bacterium]|nr:LPS assembly lipoprotein LptE [Alcanivoracaceae bacterium]
MSLLRLTVLLLIALLAGCGWQLRGAVAPAVDSLAINGGSLPLVNRLQDRLEDAGVAVYPEASRELVISRERWQTRVIAVDTLGRALEQELRYTLRWQVSTQKQQLTASREMVVTRSYSIRPDNAGGASDEARQTRELMVEDAARRLLRQLQAVDFAPQATP